jgi:large subunit ribosomal protein L21
MYAIIKTGGKQYRVSSGEKLKVERLAADVGSELQIEDVLAVGQGDDLKLGTPRVSGAMVRAKILSHGRADKVHIFKMRRRKHYDKQQGHRQNYTEIELTGITG